MYYSSKITIGAVFNLHAVKMRVGMTYELYPRAIVNQHVLHVNRLIVFVALDRLDVNEHSFLPIYLKQKLLKLMNFQTVIT